MTLGFNLKSKLINKAKNVYTKRCNGRSLGLCSVSCKRHGRLKFSAGIEVLGASKMDYIILIGFVPSFRDSHLGIAGARDGIFTIK